LLLEFKQSFKEDKMSINLTRDSLHTTSTADLRGMLYLKELSSKRADGKEIFTFVFQEINKTNVASKEQLDKQFAGRKVVFCLPAYTKDDKEKLTAKTLVLVPLRWCKDGKYNFFIERNNEKLKCTDFSFKTLPDAGCDKFKDAFYPQALESLKAG
jgi:hypothetical protein